MDPDDCLPIRIGSRKDITFGSRDANFTEHDHRVSQLQAFGGYLELLIFSRPADPQSSGFSVCYENVIDGD